MKDTPPENMYSIDSQVEEKIAEILSGSKMPTPEEIAGMRARATWLTNSVTEALFKDNRNNGIFATMANALRRPYKLPLISKVISTQVQRPSSPDALIWRKMYADVIGDTILENLNGFLNITMEIQEDQQEGFAARGIISPANIMLRNFPKGVPYTKAPDVMSICILGAHLPELDYKKHFLTRIVHSDYDEHGKHFLADKYNNFFVELTKVRTKRFPDEKLGEEYRELWEICKMLKSNIQQQKEAIDMKAVVSDVALQMADALKEVVEEPGVLENAITTEQIRETLAHVHEEGEIKGEIKGEVKGEVKKATEVTIEMLKDGMDVSLVAKYAKMPIEWVQNVQARMVTNG